LRDGFLEKGDKELFALYKKSCGKGKGFVKKIASQSRQQILFSRLIALSRSGCIFRRKTPHRKTSSFFFGQLFHFFGICSWKRFSKLAEFHRAYRLLYSQMCETEEIKAHFSKNIKIFNKRRRWLAKNLPENKK
jgi:hypothetical protein